jgi:hypothetical protein
MSMNTKNVKIANDKDSVIRQILLSKFTTQK